HGVERRLRVLRAQLNRSDGNSEAEREQVLLHGGQLWRVGAGVSTPAPVKDQNALTGPCFFFPPFFFVAFFLAPPFFFAITPSFESMRTPRATNPENHHARQIFSNAILGVGSTCVTASLGHSAASRRAVSLSARLAAREGL